MDDRAIYSNGKKVIWLSNLNERKENYLISYPDLTVWRLAVGDLGSRLAETYLTLLFLIKGVCQVLLRLEITKPRLSGKLPNRRELTTADKLAHLTEDRHRKTSYSASKLRRLPTRRSTTQLTAGECTLWWSKDIFSVLLLIQCIGDWCWEYARGSLKKSCLDHDKSKTFSKVILNKCIAVY